VRGGGAIGHGRRQRRDVRRHQNAASEPDLAVNGAGDALVAWLEHDGARSNIWCSRYVAGESWGDATSLDESDTNAFAVQVALDDGGDAVVVWKHSPDNVWANRFY
jgi:hypothetical protein